MYGTVGAHMLHPKTLFLSRHTVARLSFCEQLEENVLVANRYSDIYAYYGAEEEVPEVEPFTGINVNNIFR